MLTGNGRQIPDAKILRVAEVIRARHKEGRCIKLIGLETIKQSPEIPKRDWLLLAPSLINCTIWSSVESNDNELTGIASQVAFRRKYVQVVNKP